MSKALEEEITLLIYLPASFSPLYKYTILIAQDGQDYFQLGRLPRIAENLLSEKEIDNVIIVGVPYKTVEDRKRKYHPNGTQHQSYIRFLAHELVPYLDQEFPTYQMGMGRVLIGDSLAGTVSLMAAIQYPNTFGKVILQSPYVNKEVLTEAAAFRTNASLSIYHEIGTEETNVVTTSGEVEDFLSPNRDLAEILKKKNLDYHYEEFPGDHTWTYWQPNLAKALAKIL